MVTKKIIVSGLIGLSFILLIVSVILYLDNTQDQRKLDPLDLELRDKAEIIQYIYERQAEKNLPFYYFIPIFGFFGLVVGATIYFILSSDLERKEQIIQHKNDVILKLLGPEERKVISKIVANNGKISQTEITYLEGYTKVKAHRIVETLVQKGIVEKEVLGKMRLLHLNKELYALLKNKEE